MSHVIAGIYEIQKEIGSGGGGIVYLGWHQRLRKAIVLKADKRKLSVGSDLLRNEVNILKDLRHTYIPQVHDYVEEDGVVYTVMDFIEGESLDKLLKRKELPTQPQVIRWACQILEALSYLHNCSEHGILHGDIKPANIMLQPNGDICLIDYNIALALGEDGAVKAGFSRGYASPEHYGIEYADKSQAIKKGSIIKSSNQAERAEDTEVARIENEATAAVKGEATIVESEATAAVKGETTIVESEATVAKEKEAAMVGKGSSSVSSTNGKYTVMLDTRSDIYSLGATLYHLLSGRRPAQDAQDVEPLGPDICNPEVSVIIQKAMAPNPEQRYQSALEMLSAFLLLHKHDKRVIRHKKHARIAMVILVSAFFIGGICSFIGLKQLEQLQAALTLAEYSANALLEGDIPKAVDLALQAIPTGKSILEAPVTAQAQKALTDALGVYQLSDGFQALDICELPSAPFGLEVSPEGTCFAVIYAYEAVIFNMADGKKIVSLPIQKSALSEVRFINETHIVYAGENGITMYDLGQKQVLWVGETATTLAVSDDKTRVAAVGRDKGYAVLYQVSDGKKIAECSFEGQHMPAAVNDIFANPNNAVFSLNKDGTLLAVSFSNGGLTIFDIEEPNNNIIIYDKSEYQSLKGGFCNHYFAFAANKSGESLFGLIDTVEAVYIGGYHSQNPFLLTAKEEGIYIARENILVNFNPDTLQETELAYTEGAHISNFAIGEKYVLAATDNKNFSFYDSGANLLLTESSKENCDFMVLTDTYAILGNRNEPVLRRWKLENHHETQLLSYNPRYYHDEARISQDGKTAMLFNYQGFQVYNMEGGLVAQERLPDAESIYDQQFIKKEEGSYLEVIWYSGMVRHYSAADGTMIVENMGDAPSKDLYEEFYIGQYRIESSLHNAPKVYNRDSGKLVTTLEEESYLTYVTPIGEYIITEYISAAGERYGLLLDSEFQTIAYLPRFCDIADGKLVFDYQSGDLRQCRLYSLQELIALGEKYLEK